MESNQRKLVYETNRPTNRLPAMFPATSKRGIKSIIFKPYERTAKRTDRCEAIIKDTK